MKEYIAPKIKCFSFELESSMLQAGSENSGESTGGHSSDFNFD